MNLHRLWMPLPDPDYAYRPDLHLLSFLVALRFSVVLHRLCCELQLL